MDRPTLVYDGHCSFCLRWIHYWRQLTGEAVQYAPFQEVADQHLTIGRAEFAKAVHLIYPDGHFVRAAQAVFAALAGRPLGRVMFRAYQRVAVFRWASESIYHFIAEHRPFFDWLTRLTIGPEIRPLSYGNVQWLFLKCLALIYAIAFASFGVQAAGLIGTHGISPVGLYLTRIHSVLGSAGYRYAPSIFWLFSSDAALQWACAAGVLCAVLVFCGVWWRAALLAAFLLYLSLVSVGQDFLSFQWDLLLLETGFLAIFLGYSRVIVWLFRWLLFRLMFLSGVVKLLSGDPTWRNLTALTVHYQTQPLPTPLAWYAHQAPLWLQQLSCGVVFFIELLVPFFILAPRRLRLWSLPWLAGLQAAILLTGNYAFFNLLTLALCLWLLDDGALARLRIRANSAHIAHRSQEVVAWAATALVLILSGLQLSQALFRYVPALGHGLLAATAPYGVTNSYGLFANMTTTRPEILIEGSQDGVTWLPYEFPDKPGRLDRRPPWVAPHQPRLDWQMWFAALGSYRDHTWFVNLLARLLQGEPKVLRLLAVNPFPDRPPKYIRARVEEYRFTDSSRSNDWWTRSPLGMYVPAVTLADLSELPVLQRQE